MQSREELAQLGPQLIWVHQPQLSCRLTTATWVSSIWHAAGPACPHTPS